MAAPGWFVNQAADVAGAQPPTHQLSPGHVLQRVAQMGHLPVQHPPPTGLVVEQIAGAKVPVDDADAGRGRGKMVPQPAQGPRQHGRARPGGLFQGLGPALDLSVGHIARGRGWAEDVLHAGQAVDTGQYDGLLLGQRAEPFLVPRVAP